MSTLRTIRYRIARTGVVTTEGTPPPGYVPWAGATVRCARTAGDYAPGVVRPRSEVPARADANGEGIILLEPGPYRIVLPGGESHDVTVSAGDPDVVLDLAALLAGGVEPTDPLYPTLLSWAAAAIVEEVSAALGAVLVTGEAEDYIEIMGVSPTTIEDGTETLVVDGHEYTIQTAILTEVG